MAESEHPPVNSAMSGSLAALECIVCDKAATLLCDNCLNKARITIPFCSKEHLELLIRRSLTPVDSTRSQARLRQERSSFCNSFSAGEEADQIYELVKDEDALKGKSEWNQALYWAIRTTCETKFPGDAKSGLNSLVGILPTMRGDPARPLSSEKAESAGRLREWYTHLFANEMAEDPTVAALLPGFDLAYSTFTSGVPNTHLDDQWHSLFCHRLIAHVPLINLAMAPTTPQDQRVEAKKLADGSLQGVRRFVAETDKDAYKGFRDAVLKNMRENL